MSLRADVPSSIRRPDRARGVLDDGDTALFNRLQRVEVGGEADLVDRDDGLRPAADAPQRVGRIDVPCLRVDFREHRRAAGVQDRVGGRYEGVRRTDDLVAGADAGEDQRQMKGRRARRRRDRVRGTYPFSEERFEFRDFRPLADPTGGEHRRDCVRLCAIEFRTRKRHIA